MGAPAGCRASATVVVTTFAQAATLGERACAATHKVGCHGAHTQGTATKDTTERAHGSWEERKELHRGGNPCTDAQAATSTRPVGVTAATPHGAVPRRRPSRPSRPEVAAAIATAVRPPRPLRRPCAAAKRVSTHMRKKKTRKTAAAEGKGCRHPPPSPPPRRRHVAVAQAPPIARGAGAPGREAQPPKGNCTPTAPVSGLITPTTSSAGRWAPLPSDHRALRPRLHSMAVAIFPHHKAATRARLSTAVADRGHPPRVQVAMPQWLGVRRLPKAVSGG